jgi:dTDP-4-dehydrorhamnose 3,5-epimerase
VARFDFTPTPIPGVVLVQRQRVEDSRGFLARLYCADEFRAAGLTTSPAQVNLTMTLRKGCVRGMHFQRPPHAEAKLVSCIRGDVLDVVVDLRRRSPTFLRWHGERISAANQRSLLIPEGCAHGFQALTDGCELLYLHTTRFEPSAEGAVNAVDPRLGIEWPLDITELSDRDRSHPLLDVGFAGLDL